MADLTSADIPQSAQYVRTLGYYAANDGGGADYRIVAQSFSDIRSLELKDGRFANILTDVGNIRQFGCKSGGTEDCAPTINSLLKIYSDVYIPDGTYSISTSIVLPGPNQLIRGQSSYNTKILVSQDVPAVSVPTKQRADFSTVRSLSFNVTSKTYTSDLMSIPNSQTFTLDQVIVNGPDGADDCRIFIGDSSDGSKQPTYVATVRNCRFYHAHVELKSTDSYVVNNEIWATGLKNAKSALRLTGAHNTLVSGNQVVNSTASNTEGAISLVNSMSIRLHGNYVDGSLVGYDTGIGIYSLSCSRVSMTNNLIWHARQSGLRIVDCNAWTIVGNSFDDCNYYNGPYSDVVVLSGTQQSSFGNVIANNVFYREFRANEDHTSEVNRVIPDDKRAVINVTSNSSRLPTLVTGNVIQDPDKYLNAQYTGLVQSYGNNTILFSNRGNGVQNNGDVGNLFIDSGKLKVIAPNGSAVEIGTI